MPPTQKPSASTPTTSAARQNKNDSKTKVYQRLHGKRDVVSIRMKPELKEALSEFCRANGLSLCHVTEMLVSGYLTGMKQKIQWVNQSPTIELTVVRDVKRVRRYVRESDGGRDVFIEDVGDASHCAFCSELPMFQAGSWTDRFHYVRTWLCEVHFDKKQWMEEGKNWRCLGE